MNSFLHFHCNFWYFALQ